MVRTTLIIITVDNWFGRHERMSSDIHSTFQVLTPPFFYFSEDSENVFSSKLPEILIRPVKCLRNKCCLENTNDEMR